MRLLFQGMLSSRAADPFAYPGKALALITEYGNMVVRTHQPSCRCHWHCQVDGVLGSVAHDTSLQE